METPENSLQETFSPVANCRYIISLAHLINDARDTRQRRQEAVRQDQEQLPSAIDELAKKMNELEEIASTPLTNVAQIALRDQIHATVSETCQYKQEIIDLLNTTISERQRTIVGIDKVIGLRLDIMDMHMITNHPESIYPAAACFFEKYGTTQEALSNNNASPNNHGTIVQDCGLPWGEGTNVIFDF